MLRLLVLGKQYRESITLLPVSVLIQMKIFMRYGRNCVLFPKIIWRCIVRGSGIYNLLTEEMDITADRMNLRRRESIS